MLEKRKSANILAVFIMIMWGLSYLSIKIVVREINPALAAFYRFLISSVILCTFLKVRHQEEKVLKEDKLKMALGGLFGVSLYFFFENYSVLFTSASNVSILISSIPVFTLISQRIVFKEKMTPLKIIGACFSVIGIVIIVASKNKVSLFSEGTLGDIMALGAALCWVIYNVITSKFKGNYKSITVTTYQSIWGCIFLSPSLIFINTSVPSFKAISNLMYLAIFCSCIAYVMYIYCLEHLGATIITTYINLQPIISLISAAIILKEVIVLNQIIGCIIIVIGVFFVTMDDKFNLKKFKDMI